MTNEIYHILGASIRAAKMGIGTGVIIVLKRQHKGKTHTVKMLSRDHNPSVLRIPPGTEAAIYEFLASTQAHIYYIDDKDKWDRDSFSVGLRYIKNLSDGEKTPLKMTHYTKEQVKDPQPSSAWSWLLLNKPQYDSSMQIITETGIGARAIILRSNHTEAEYNKIQDFYENNGLSGSKLPTLKIHENWYIPTPRIVTSQEKIQIKLFPEDMRDNIMCICKVMSEVGFAAVLPCLQYSSSGKYFDEYIEFESGSPIWKKSQTI